MKGKDLIVEANDVATGVIEQEVEAKPDDLDQLRSYMALRRQVAGRAELLAQGFRWSRIRSWVRTGRLVSLFRGVYSYGRDIETPEAAWFAATVAAG